MAKALIRWAGSKRRLIPVLKEHWEGGDSRYLEPFAGSACLFFDLEPNRAVLGDINAELIGTYRTIRTFPRQVHRSLSTMSGDERTYYRVRAQEPRRLSSLARAARFVYLNRYCFNGLYRTNADGQFNVPYGGGKSGSLPTLNELLAASVLLGRAKLMAGDFGTVVAQAGKGDFVYLDPPYHVTSRRVFREYNSRMFSHQDVCRLRVAMEAMDAAKARFVVSYAESVEGRFLARDLRVRRIVVRRNIAGFAGHRRSSQELLISNF